MISLLAPTQSAFDPSDAANGLVIAGNEVYIAQSHSGMLVVDVSDPTHPTASGTYNNSDVRTDVAVGGGCAYPPLAETWVQVVNVNDPLNVTEVITLHAPLFPAGVALAGSYAYVIANNSFTGKGWLKVWDMSDPANPVGKGYVEVEDAAWKGAWVRSVAVSGNYAYDTDDNGLTVVDVQDPANPSIVGRHKTALKAEDVAVVGGYACVAANDGLYVVDVRDPAQPVKKGSLSTPEDIQRVTAAGGYVYVATNGGLRIVDVSDPTHPTELGYYATTGPRSVAAEGDYAYVCDGVGGLYIL